MVLFLCLNLPAQQFFDEDVSGQELGSCQCDCPVVISPDEEFEYEENDIAMEESWQRNPTLVLSESSISSD
jgi:hypothetical protein